MIPVFKRVIGNKFKCFFFCFVLQKLVEIDLVLSLISF